MAFALEDSLFRGVSLTSLAVGVARCPFALSWTYSSFAALATDRYEAYATAIGAQNVVALLLGGGLGAAFGVTGAVAGVSASHALVALGIYIWGARAFGAAPVGWLRRRGGPAPRRGLLRAARQPRATSCSCSTTGRTCSC